MSFRSLNLARVATRAARVRALPVGVRTLVTPTTPATASVTEAPKTEAKDADGGY